MTPEPRPDRLGIQRNYGDIFQRHHQHIYLLGVVDSKTRKPIIPEDAAIGTAFAVSKEGHFLTAFHTIKKRHLEGILDGSRLLAVKGVAGHGAPAENAVQVEVVEAYPRSDFLLLKAPVARQSCIPLTAVRVPIGALVATIGFPLSHYDEDTEKVWVGKRMVSAMVSTANDKGGVRDVELDKHLSHGHSGGPVFGMGGTCVAMAVDHKRAWHEVDVVSVVDGTSVKETKLMHLPTQFSTANLITNIAGRLRKQGVPVFLDPERFPEATETA